MLDPATDKLPSLENYFNSVRKVRRVRLQEIAGRAQSKCPLGSLWRGILTNEEYFGIG
jgi:hypothetical protein